MPWFITTVIGQEAINKAPHYANRRTRTFGFYNEYYAALKSVEENRGSMCEGLYDYLVIEYIEQGIHSEVHKEEWFKWIHPNWIPCDKPEELKGIVNFALG